MAYLHLILVVAITIHQLRRVFESGVDTLTFIASGYVLAYGVAPAYFYAADWDSVLAEYGVAVPYQSRSEVNINQAIEAFLLYVFGYLIICGAYKLANGRRRPSVVPSDTFWFLNIAGISCLVVGGGSLAFYIYKVGGIEPYFSLAMFFRADSQAIWRYGLENVAFLKNVSSLILAAAIFFATALKIRQPEGVWLAKVLFWLSFIGSAMVLIHQAGRVFLGGFLVSFFVTAILGRRRFPIFPVLVWVLLFSWYAAVGKALFWKMAFREQVVENVSAGTVFHTMMGEILFPHITTLTAMRFAPDPVPYRYFADIPIAIYNLIPSAPFQISKIRNVGEVNTDLIANGSGIPVDVLGFGYYSFGFLGVIIWLVFFGSFAAWLDSMLSDSGRVLSLVRAFTAVTFGLRVSYSEPSHILLGSLHVVAVLSCLVPFIIWSRARVKAHSEPESYVPGLRISDTFNNSPVRDA